MIVKCPCSVFAVVSINRNIFDDDNDDGHDDDDDDKNTQRAQTSASSVSSSLYTDIPVVKFL